MTQRRDDQAPSIDRALDAQRNDQSPLWRARVLVAELLGLVGIVLYNWWVYVIVATNLLTSTNAFFSDLEATGRRDL